MLDRSWSERNGNDPGDWNGSSSSPRKGMSGSSLMENNWRRQRTNSEDDEGWRTASNMRGEKWGMSRRMNKTNKLITLDNLILNSFYNILIGASKF